MGDNLITSDLIAAEVGVITRINHAIRRLPDSKAKYARDLNCVYTKMSSDSWEKKFMKSLSIFAKSHFEREARMYLQGGPTARAKPPDILLGNLNIWKTLKYLIDSEKVNPKSLNKISKDIKEKIMQSVSSNLYRLGEGVSKSEKRKLYSDYTENVDYVCKLYSLAQHLRELHTAAVRKFNGILANISKIESNEEDITISITRGMCDYIGIDVSVIGALVLLKTREFEVVLTNVHFYRLTRMLEQFSNLVLSAKDLSLRVSAAELPENIVRIFWDLIKTDTDLLGEVLKGIRTVLVAKLDTYQLWEEESFRLILQSFSSERKYWVKECMPDFRQLCHTTEDAINLTNIFRAVPHPDTNLADVFDSIVGFKNPNRHKPGIEGRFIGTLRKNLYESMVGQNYEVRLRSTGTAGDLLERLSHDTQKSFSRIMNQPFTSWTKVEFERVRSVPDVENMIIRPASKASQLPCEVDEEELRMGKEWSMGLAESPPKLIRDLRTINDAASVLKGESKLDPDKAIKRLEKCIELHEQFEEKFPNMFPEDIPASQFEKFIKETPAARYCIGTEPKFGEVHKKVTRMFYIAEQELKVITQRIERLGKQLARKSVGVSIVKSYAGRRRDLENFCKNMTGSNSEMLSIFVSFDMSEFSKKFPMELVRIYGKVLSEITGVDWLKRIDIIFRSAFVIHNSRGFFDYVTGVKGGFEGFLNFGWSVIHATIMKIALESTGVEGELLTFSDDGLLCFYVKDDTPKEEVRRKVTSIQTVYSNHGLEFKMAKTLIATNVWEYLGDVCHNNHLLNMWVKELMSIGRSEMSPGIEPFSHQIDSVEGQSDACIAAGSNPLTTCIIKRNIASLRLRRIATNLPLDVEEALFLLPKTAGGFRLRSVSETCLLSTIETDSEIIADIFLLYKEKKSLATAIINGLYSNSKVLRKPIDGVMKGSRFSTTHSDTSGFKVLNEAIEIAKGNATSGFKIVTNPAKTELGNRLNDILPNIDNLNPKLISDLIFSTPEWALYSDSISLVKGRGAIRIISRKDLKRLQSKDTRNCKNAVKEWRKIIEEEESINFELFEKVRLITQRTMRGLNLVRLRPSPRITIVCTKENPNIIVDIEEFDAKSVASAYYREPPVIFPSDVTTLSWYSERGADGDITSLRRFLVSVARFISYAPDAEDVIRMIASVVDIDLPAAPYGLTRGAHRRGRGSTESPDMRVVIPRCFDSLSGFRYIGGLDGVVYGYEHADRKTVGEAARVISAVRWISSKRDNQRLVRGHYIMTYKINQEFFEPSFSNTPPRVLPGVRFKFNPSPMSRELKKEYEASIIEFNTYRESVGYLDDLYVGNIKPGSLEHQFYENCLGKALEEWIMALIRKQGSTLTPERSSPLPLISQTRICEKSIIRAAFRLLDGIDKRELMDSVHKYLIEQEHLQERTGRGWIWNCPKDKVDEILKPYMMKIVGSKGYIETEKYILDGCDLCLFANVPGSSTDTLRVITTFPNILGVLNEFLRSEYIIGGGLVMVVRPDDSKGFTKNHRKAIREAFTANISYIYSLFADNEWKDPGDLSVIGFGTSTDELLDNLVVFRSIIRESEHRTKAHPANQTTSRIELFKFYRAAHDVMKTLNRKRQVKATDGEIEKMIADWRIDDESLAELKAAIDSSRFTRGRGVKPLGPDHTKMLTQGIRPDAIRRCRVIIGKPNKRYNSTYFGVGPYSSDAHYVEYHNIMNQASSFYSTVINEINNKMKDYPVRTERLLLERFSPSTSQLASVFGAIGFDDKIYGEAVALESLSDDVSSAVMDLLGSHLNEMAFERRKVGYNTTRSTNSIVRAMISVPKDDSGPIVRYITDQVEGSHYTAYLIMLKKKHAAINSYLNLAKMGSAAIFKTEGYEDETYYISGVADDNKVKLIDEMKSKNYVVKMHEYNEKKCDFPGAIVPTVTFELQAKTIGTLVRSRINYGGLSRHSLNPMGFMTRFSRYTGRNAQANDESEMLQAAIFAASTNQSNSVMIGCYIAVMLWLQGKENPKLIELVASDLFNRDARRLNEIKNDIGLVFTWLVSTNAHPSSSLDGDKILSIQDEISKLTVIVPVSLTVTDRGVRQISGLRESSELKGLKLKQIEGRISSLLYEDPGCKAVKGPQVIPKREFDPALLEEYKSILE
nr:MAG: RNA-dependent RNA polymerase [brine shrimp yue-like virus 4]